MDLYNEALKIMNEPRVAIGTLVIPPDDFMLLVGEVYFTPCVNYPHEKIFGAFLFLSKYMSVPLLKALIVNHPKEMLDTAMGMHGLKPHDFITKTDIGIAQNVLITILYRIAYKINHQDPIRGLDEVVLLLGRDDIATSKVIGIDDPDFDISGFAYDKMFDVILNAIFDNAIRESKDHMLQ